MKKLAMTTSASQESSSPPPQATSRGVGGSFDARESASSLTSDQAESSRGSSASTEDKTKGLESPKPSLVVIPTAVKSATAATPAESAEVELTGGLEHHSKVMQDNGCDNVDVSLRQPKCELNLAKPLVPPKLSEEEEGERARQADD